MVPYFEQPVLPLGPVKIHAFGVLVAVAMLVGIQGTIARCRKLSLDTNLCADLLFYTLIAAFVSAHLTAVFAYFPREVANNPWMLLKIWENISSFGGILGALFGVWVFFPWEALPHPPRRARLSYHALGWYEFLFTLLFLCPAFLILDRKPRPTGFFPLAFVLMYVPVRFFLDFLRISDARYGGLTFGQYAAIAGLAPAGGVFRPARPQRRGKDDDHRDPDRPAGAHGRAGRRARAGVGKGRPVAPLAHRGLAAGDPFPGTPHGRGGGGAVRKLLSEQPRPPLGHPGGGSRGEGRRLDEQTLRRTKAAACSCLRAGGGPGTARPGRGDPRGP